MDHDMGRSETEKLVDAIMKTYEGDSGINFIDVKNLPVREKIVSLLELFTELLFPGYTGRHEVKRDNIRFVVGKLVCSIRQELSEQIALALRHQCRMKNCPTCDCEKMAQGIADDVVGAIPRVRQML